LECAYIFLLLNLYYDSKSVEVATKKKQKPSRDRQEALPRVELAPLKAATPLWSRFGYTLGGSHIHVA